MTEIPDGLLKALHAVQANAPTLTKDATGQVGSRHYKYTPLDTIVEKIGPLLRTNHLVWTTRPEGSHVAPVLIYELIHVPTGEKIDGEMPLMVGEHPTSQALGSAITYARRYALTAVLNLVADEDDDAAAAQNYGRSSGEMQSGRPMASVAQGTLIKKMLKEKKVTPDQLQVILDTIGIKVAPDHAGWIQELTGGKDGQASALITFLKENPIPEGTSDVPSDTEPFEQPSLEGGDPAPWEDNAREQGAPKHSDGPLDE